MILHALNNDGYKGGSRKKFNRKYHIKKQHKILFDRDTFTFFFT